MYYFYGRVNRGHIACPLYGGCPYLGLSVMGGSTVLPLDTLEQPVATHLSSCMYNIIPRLRDFTKVSWNTAVSS